MLGVMCIQDRVFISSSLTIRTHYGVPRHCTIESTIHAEQMLWYLIPGQPWANSAVLVGPKASTIVIGELASHVVPV